MLMAHSSLLQAITEHSESIFKHANPIPAVVSVCYVAARSLQFCLKKHSGNVEILSQARGPNLTGSGCSTRRTRPRAGEVKYSSGICARRSFWGLSRSELNGLKKSFEFDIMLIKRCRVAIPA